LDRAKYRSVVVTAQRDDARMAFYYEREIIRVLDARELASYPSAWGTTGMLTEESIFKELRTGLGQAHSSTISPSDLPARSAAERTPVAW
jgi:hypothetical protein